MSSPKNLNARERARLAAEQAAARKRDQRILISVVAAFVVVVVAGGIVFQAWRTSRSPSAAPIHLRVGQSGHHHQRTADPLLARPTRRHDHLVRGLPLPALRGVRGAVRTGHHAGSRERRGAGRALPDVLHRRGFGDRGQRDGLCGRSRLRSGVTIWDCSPTTRCNGVIRS